MSIKKFHNNLTLTEPFMKKSGGGVTVSGRRASWFRKTLPAVFLKPAVRQEYIPVLSQLSVQIGKQWRPAEYADLLISDIKHMDSDVHQKYTGAGNEKMLANLKRLATCGHDMILRIPVIPGINDDMENIIKTADYIEDNIGDRLRVLRLLSFMRMGEEKCLSLGRTYEMDSLGLDREISAKS